MHKKIMLVIVDPNDPTETLRCIGPFATHVEAGEAGGSRQLPRGEFWTVEIEAPEANTHLLA